MEYKELQNQAKELGLPFVGVSAEDLQKSIQEAQAKEAPVKESPKKEKPAKEAHKANTAIVLDGGREVRRYEANVHGEDFEKLANEFADKRGYTVSVENFEAGLVCPHCGKKLNRKKLGI